MSLEIRLDYRISPAATGLSRFSSGKLAYRKGVSATPQRAEQGAQMTRETESAEKRSNAFRKTFLLPCQPVFADLLTFSSAFSVWLDRLTEASLESTENPGRILGQGLICYGQRQVRSNLRPTTRRNAAIGPGACMTWMISPKNQQTNWGPISQTTKV